MPSCMIYRCSVTGKTYIASSIQGLMHQLNGEQSNLQKVRGEQKQATSVCDVVINQQMDAGNAKSAYPSESGN